MTYEDYLRSPEWHERAREAQELAGWECALCTSDQRLEVHHRTYARLGREEVRDLVVLCDECHRRHHVIFDRNQLWLPGFRVRIPDRHDLN